MNIKYEMSNQLMIANWEIFECNSWGYHECSSHTICVKDYVVCWHKGVKWRKKWIVEVLNITLRVPKIKPFVLWHQGVENTEGEWRYGIKRQYAKLDSMALQLWLK